MTLYDFYPIKNLIILLKYYLTCSIIKVLWSEISREVFVALMTRTDEDGNTPLHLCCKNGHIAVVRKLVAILKVDGVLQKANRSLHIPFTLHNNNITVPILIKAPL